MNFPTVALKRVASVHYGLGQPPQLSDVGVPIIRATNISRGAILDTDLIFAKLSDLPLCRTPLLRPGEVLVVRSGAYTGDSALVTERWAGSAPGYDLRVTPGRQLHPNFLAYVLRSLPVLHQIDIAKNRAAQPHLNAEDLGEIAVAVPPLEEQRRIADFLEHHVAKMDQSHELLVEIRAASKERFDAQLAELATGAGCSTALRTGNPWIPTAPESWRVMPLKRAWTIVDCKHRTPEYLDDGYPVISPGDVSPGRLDLSVAHRFVGAEDLADLADGPRRPRRGDIIYSRNATVGVAAYVDTDEPFSMGQDVCRITSRDHSQLFLAYFLNSVARAEIEARQVGSTFGRINISTLLEVSVPCPPPPEQFRLAEAMDEAADYSARLQRAIDRQLVLLAERRQSLISAAVTGQIDVNTARGVEVS